MLQMTHGIYVNEQKQLRCSKPSDEKRRRNVNKAKSVDLPDLLTTWRKKKVRGKLCSSKQNKGG